MPRCPYCPPDPATGKKIVHRSIRRDCPTFAQLKARRKAEAAAEAPAPVAPEQPKALADPGAPAATPKPAAKPKKRMLRFLGRASESIATGAAQGAADRAKPVQEFDWELADETHSRFWIACTGFARSLLNLINVQLLGLPELPDHLIHLGKADLDALNDGFKGPTSKLLYKMGFKTLEGATRAVNSFTMISTFGLQGIQVAIWYAQNVPKSPKLKAWRERQRAKAKEIRARTLTEQEKARALEVTGQDVTEAAPAPPPHPAAAGAG